MDKALSCVQRLTDCIQSAKNDKENANNSTLQQQLSTALSIIDELNGILSLVDDGDTKEQETLEASRIIERNLSDLSDGAFDRILDQVTDNDSETRSQISPQNSLSFPLSPGKEKSSKFTFKPQSDMFAKMKKKLKNKKNRSSKQLSLNQLDIPDGDDENGSQEDSLQVKPILQQQASLTNVHGGFQIDLPESETKVVCMCKVYHIVFVHVFLIFFFWFLCVFIYCVCMCLTNSLKEQ